MGFRNRRQAASPQALQVHDVHTILGPETRFHGKLVFDGAVRIDGVFHGEIHTRHLLIIGASAQLEACLWVGTLLVHGSLVGDIYATQSVELHAPARVRGNIQTTSLHIERGVVFEGNTHMGEAPPEKSLELPITHTAVTLLKN